MSEESENLSTSETKLLLRVRLGMENEFASGRGKKSVLWNKVVEEIKKVNKDIKIDKHLAQRKFLNLLVTYKRIKNRPSDKKATSWLHFDDFDKVYGTRQSISVPTDPLGIETTLLNLQEDNDTKPAECDNTSNENDMTALSKKIKLDTSTEKNTVMTIDKETSGDQETNECSIFCSLMEAKLRKLNDNLRDHAMRQLMQVMWEFEDVQKQS